MEIFTTTYENNHLKEITESLSLMSVENAENQLITLYPHILYQKFYGFGGMFTESGGYCLKSIPDKTAYSIMEDLFGENGLSYTCGRVHLGSCDASLSNYSQMEDPDDLEMKSFSLERDHQYLIPMIKMAQEICPQPLNLMISPWSPPAFMKTNGERNHGGKLKPEYREFWARYICRFLKEYEKIGIRFSMITLQNEASATQIWDSCLYTAEEEKDYLKNYLIPQLKAEGLDYLDIFIWDHNKEKALERALIAYGDAGVKEDICGVAVHWYSGDHFEQLEMLKKEFPNKRIVFSEGGLEEWRFPKEDHLGRAEFHAHDIIGDLNNGIDCFLQWSMIFDQTGGPNHVQNLCETSIMVNTETGEYVKTLPYYYIGHFSRYIKPGAVRIGFSRYTDQLEVTAFKNPAGSLAVIVLNRREKAVPYYLRLENKVCQITAAAHSISTITI